MCLTGFFGNPGLARSISYTSDSNLQVLPPEADPWCGRKIQLSPGLFDRVLHSVKACAELVSPCAKSRYFHTCFVLVQQVEGLRARRTRKALFRKLNCMSACTSLVCLHTAFLHNSSLCVLGCLGVFQVNRLPDEPMESYHKACNTSEGSP